jgi:LPXTG-motif cell wall-anchored protein
MRSVKFSRTILRNLLGVGLFCMAFTLSANAQVQTYTGVDNGPTMQEVKIERGVVVYVSGNDVVIKGEDGRIRDFPNVPESARVTVDGQQLSVHDVQPGMTIERTTITTTTPRIITTIKTVTGTVWYSDPPTSVILTLEDGKNQQFRVPDGTKFTVDGQKTDVFSLRKGMKVSATAVTEVPETVMTTEVNRTGKMPPPPPESIDAAVALLIVMVPIAPAANASPAPVETAAAAPADPAPTELPKTGSSIPLVGLLGGVFFSLALGLRARRALGSR